MLRDEGVDGHARMAVRDVVQMGMECSDDSNTVLDKRGQQQKHAKHARLTYYPSELHALPEAFLSHSAFEKNAEKFPQKV